jgi:hypothetical protein
MATRQARNRRLLRTPLITLLCLLMALCGEGLVPLPFFVPLTQLTTSEEEVPSGKGDTADAATPLSPAGGRHRHARRHRPLPCRLMGTSLALATAPQPDSHRLHLPPPPRERDRHNGVGGPLRC